VEKGVWKEMDVKRANDKTQGRGEKNKGGGVGKNGKAARGETSRLKIEKRQKEKNTEKTRGGQRGSKGIGGLENSPPTLGGGKRRRRKTF